MTQVLNLSGGESLELLSQVILTGDFEIIFDNFRFTSLVPPFQPLVGTKAASTDFLIYRGYWEFRANGNGTAWLSTELPITTRLGRTVFTRVGSTGTITYNGTSVAKTVATDAFTFDAFNLTNTTLFGEMAFGNITVKQGGSVVYYWDFDNASLLGTDVSETETGNTAQGVGIAATNWDDIPEAIPSTLQSTMLLPNGAQGQNPSGGWTCTGLDRFDNGTWLVGNDGRSTTTDPTQTPSLIVLSSDMTTINQELDMTPIIGGNSIQGVVIDPDGSYWFASQSLGQLTHVTNAGVLIDSWAIPLINGLAYDTSRGTSGSLWFSEQASNSSLKRWDIATETIITADEIPHSLTFPDQLYYQANTLYLTDGGNGENGSVFIFDVVTKQITSQINSLESCQAIEGIYVDNQSMWVTNDGGFHTEADPMISAGLEYTILSPAVIVDEVLSSVGLNSHNPTVQTVGTVGLSEQQSSVEVISRNPSILLAAQVDVSESISTLTVKALLPVVTLTGTVGVDETLSLCEVISNDPTIVLVGGITVTEVTSSTGVYSGDPQITLTGTVEVQELLSEIEVISHNPSVIIGTSVVVNEKSSSLEVLTSNPAITLTGVVATTEVPSTLSLQSTKPSIQLVGAVSVAEVISLTEIQSYKPLIFVGKAVRIDSYSATFADGTVSSKFAPYYVTTTFRN